MNIEVGDKLVLSDNIGYIVTSKAQYQGSNYCFLLDENDPSNVKICVENPSNGTLVRIVDDETIKQLLPLFFESSKRYIDNVKLEKETE